MEENELTGSIIGICIRIHSALGPGLLESEYEEVLCHELQNMGFNFNRQKAVGVIYNDIRLGLGFRADIIMENKVIIEIKSIENILPVHHKQILTYLKLTGLKVGLLINFNVPLMKNGIHRIVNNF